MRFPYPILLTCINHTVQAAMLMYIPPTTTARMATATVEEEELSLETEVTSSTATSMYIKWTLEGVKAAYVQGFQVTFSRVASKYVRHSDPLPPNVNTYEIDRLVADTYYKVCVSMFRNDTTDQLQKCVQGSTTSWHIPVSIGSSIGAVLALSIIVLIVFLSRCPALIRQPRTAAAESSKYDSMSSHFPDDRYEMSDTTTHCHDHDDDMFSQNSEGDSLTDTTKGSAKQSLNSPQSLAERVWNGNRVPNGVTGKRPRVPLGKCGRTLSLTDRRHAISQQYKARQARLAHLHANFHSIQSEPGAIPVRSVPRVNITDFPASTHVRDLASTPKEPHHSSLPTPSGSNNHKTFMGCTGCNNKPAGFKDTPRLLYRIESATSSSEPAAISKATPTNEAKPARKPALKNIPRTFHMSIDADTLV